MLDPKQKTDDLTALWACITVARQLEGNRAIGEYLVDAFTKNKRLAFYFMAAYTPAMDYGIKSTDAKPHYREACQAVREQPGLPLNNMATLLAAMAARDMAGPVAAQAWALFLAGLPKELIQVANLVLDKDLQIPGLTVDLLNKVMVKCNHNPVPTEVACPGLSIRLAAHTTAPDSKAVYISGRVCVDGFPTAEITLIREHARVTIAKLRAAGIRVGTA